MLRPYDHPEIEELRFTLYLVHWARSFGPSKPRCRAARVKNSISTTSGSGTIMSTSSAARQIMKASRDILLTTHEIGQMMRRTPDRPHQNSRGTSGIEKNVGAQYAVPDAFWRGYRTLLRRSGLPGPGTLAAVPANSTTFVVQK